MGDGGFDAAATVMLGRLKARHATSITYRSGGGFTCGNLLLQDLVFKLKVLRAAKAQESGNAATKILKRIVKLRRSELATCPWPSHPFSQIAD
jgi:hypothetical protein